MKPSQLNPQLNPTPSGVLGTVAKLIRLTGREGVEWSHWQHPTNNPTARRNLVAHLQMGCPRANSNSKVVTLQLPDGEALCRLILGDDYLTPEEMARAQGHNLTYTEKQLEHFTNTVPDAQTVFWLRVNEFILVAGPIMDLDVPRIRDINNKPLESEYVEHYRRFVPTDVVKAGQWLAISKKIVPNSLGKTWQEQQDLLTEVEYIPNVAEISYVAAVYYKARGISLLHCGESVRTSSVDDVDRRAAIYNFHKGNFGIDYYRDDDRFDSLGIVFRNLTLST